MEFKLEENLFDSGIIAPKVGNLILENYRSLQDNDSDRIVHYARSNNYNLVTLAAEELLDLKDFVHFGTIYEVEADFTDVWDCIKDIPERFYIRQINESDWLHIKKLLYTYPPTRYSKDPNVTMEQVVVHKLNILKHLADKYPKYALGAFSSNDELIGFHFLRVLNNIILLQELLVNPGYRIGFVSLQLVKENLKIIRANSDLQRLATRVYEDNKTSINFFTKLKFLQLKKKEHYYHMWV